MVIWILWLARTLGTNPKECAPEDEVTFSIIECTISLSCSVRILIIQVRGHIAMVIFRLLDVGHL